MATASIHLQRNRIVVTGYISPKGTSGWLPNYLKVFDGKSKRYDDDKKYSYVLDDGSIIFPRTCEVRHIVQRLNSQGYDIEGIFD